MKCNVETPVKDYEGRVINETDFVEGKVVSTNTPLTYRRMISNLLNTPKLNDQGQPIPDTAEDKTKIFEISTKLFGGKEVELTSSQISFIVEKAKAVASPLQLGRIMEFLGEKEDEPKAST